jgi:peroxiredoxin
MLLKLALRSLALAGIALLSSGVIASGELPGLHAGDKIPAISLTDQNGKVQDLHSLAGPNGLLLLFFRSADWCPFCKGQLVDLEGAQEAFAAKGINVAGVSYDSPAILADFTRRRSITYPLLSDTSSALIDAFGIRNPEGTGMEAGIPYPGYYLIEPSGVIRERFFETAYVNRLTANALYGNIFGESAVHMAARTIDATPHVSVTTTQSDEKVTPGEVVRLDVNLTPGKDTHVYAPGADKMDYRVITLKMEPSELYTATDVSYPKSENMNFPELKQIVPVYTGKTVLSTQVAAQVNRNTMTIFHQNPTLVVKGELEYQACTSSVCFPPVKAAMEWKIALM